MADAAAARAFDRRLFFAAALLFPLLVVAGFGRTYYLKPLLGGPALPSLVVHLHGLVMTLWVALFSAQVWLISSRRVRWHQRLGLSSIGLAVVLVVVGFLTAVRAAKYGSAASPPGIPPLAFLAVPLFDLLMFALLFGGAIYFRRKPAAHKALMLLTALNFLPPALARIPLPTLQALGPLWFFGVPTILACLCIALDWRRRGHAGVVLVAGTILLVGSYAVRLALMGTDTWMRTAAWLTSFV